MNKYQEALIEVEEIAYKQYEDACYNKTTKALAMEYEQKLKDNTKILQELVDKETPMKPKMNDYKITRLDKIIGIEQTYTCPRCRNACLEMLAVNKRNIHRYCYDCGQKLDWNDINE